MKKKDAIFAFSKNNPSNYLHPSNNQIYTFLLRYLLSEKVKNFAAFDSTIFSVWQVLPVQNGSILQKNVMPIL